MRIQKLRSASLACALVLLLCACRTPSPAPTPTVVPTLLDSPAPTQAPINPTATPTRSPPTPTPLPTWPERWVATGGPDGGLIQAIAVNPADPQTLYAAGAGAAVYKSNDGGENWSPGERLAPPSCPFSSLVIDAEESDTVYAANSCAGVFKSPDGGTTWLRADTGIEGEVTLLVQSPHTPGLLLAANNQGQAYRSRDGAATWEPINDGLSGGTIRTVAATGPDTYWATAGNDHDGTLYRFSNGVWSAVPNGQPQGIATTSVLVDPLDPATLYIGLANAQKLDQGPDAVFILRSTDGGFNWSPLPLPELPEEAQSREMATRVHLLAKGQLSGVLYAVADSGLLSWSDAEETWQQVAAPGDLVSAGVLRQMAIDPTNNAVLYLPLGGTGIAKSEDGGQSWRAVNRGLNNASISHVVTHPNDPATLYIAPAGGMGVLKSTDYGNTWTKLDGATSHYPLARWTEDLVLDPNQPDTVYQIVDGARVSRSNDAGATWSSAWPEFRLSSIYNLAVAPSDPGILYANKSGFGLFRSDDGGQAWRFLAGSGAGVRDALAVHPNNPDLILSGADRGPSEASARLHRSTDGGVTWGVTLDLPDADGITAAAFDPRVEPVFPRGKQPADPTRLYAASVGRRGSLWFSNDAGDSWQPLNDALSFTSVRALVTAPHRPGVAYAAVWGGGTWRTEDGGQSWLRLPGDPATSAVAVAVDPSNHNIVYIADGTTPHLYRSTDGGNSWDLLFDAGAPYGRLTAMALAPSDPTIVYVSATVTTAEVASGAIFRVDTNAPPGANVSDITSDLPAPPTSLAVHRRDPRRIFAIVPDGGVWKTVDDGASWRQVKGDLPRVNFTQITVDPILPDTLFLTGSSLLSAELRGLDPNEVYGVWKSTDDGNTWARVGGTTLGRASGPVKAVAFHPDDQRVMYAAGQGGIYLSPDRGETWTSINGRLPFVPMNTVATDGQTLYAGSAGAGVYTGALHPLIHTADWAPESHLAVPIAHVQITLHADDPGTLYASAYPGGVFKTTDGGATWSAHNAGLPSFAVADPSRQGYYALAPAPSAPEVLYLGLNAQGIYRSDDGAATWRPVNGDAGELRGARVQALLVHPEDAEIVYVATGEGVWRTVNGGRSWADFSARLPPGGDVRALALGSDGRLYAGSRGYGVYSRSAFHQAEDDAWRQLPPMEDGDVPWFSPEDPVLPRDTPGGTIRHASLLIDPGDPNTLYTWSYRAGVYKTTDGGVTWREHNVGLENRGVFFLAFHPGDPQTLYSATADGIARSLDGGAIWRPQAVGWPPGQWVLSIAFDPSNPAVLYACSTGNGTGQGGGTVMKSTDGGATWFEIVLGLDVSQAFYQVLVDRRDPQTLYLLTERDGVYLSRDAGATWTSWNEGLWSRVPGNLGHAGTEVLRFSAVGRLIYFGSAGSGVWRRPAEGTP